MGPKFDRPTESAVTRRTLVVQQNPAGHQNPRTEIYNILKPQPRTSNLEKMENPVLQPQK